MYVTVRRYTADPAFADELVRRRADVESIIRGVPGFRSYYLARTDDGVVTITVCDDRAGTEESTRRAGEYVRDNLSQFAGTPPQISSGEVLIDLSR